MRAATRNATLRNILGEPLLENMAATHRGDKRREERVCTALPVNLGNATGTTRNVSASGMFFETDAACTRGGAISVAVEFDTPGGKMKLNCEGRIVRVEPRDSRVGVAVKIVESKMELLEQ